MDCLTSKKTTIFSNSVLTSLDFRHIISHACEKGSAGRKNAYKNWHADDFYCKLVPRISCWIIFVIPKIVDAAPFLGPEFRWLQSTASCKN